MITAWFANISITYFINDSLIRLVMNGVLVLSLIPMLNAGVGINYGLPIGVVAGLMGMCLAVNFNIKEGLGFILSFLFSIPIAVIFGYIYSMILNRVKGKEEITATFVGFSFIYLTSLFWSIAPFNNPSMLWPIGGEGMRPTIGLKPYFEKILNNLWVIEIQKIKIPLGMLFFYFGLCIFIKFFFKTKIGIASIAVGENETFAKLSGIDIPKIRTLAIILSTVIAALGICVYSQSYGFIELYDAPLMVAFSAASAILMGGGKEGKTKVTHAVIGTYLFQTIYILSAPIANELLLPEVAEIFRNIITNGVILYAILYKNQKNSSSI
ncbi:MAG: ABC transporter permease [Desulfobacterales bacterium]|nr:ABC transporter permease [Desulfobacterales bacterium]